VLRLRSSSMSFARAVALTVMTHEVIRPARVQHLGIQSTHPPPANANSNIA